VADMRRRSFLATLAAGTLGSARLGRPAPSSSQLPLCFSTLGCPAWPWRKILGEAHRLGYSAIELRGLMGEMDLTKRPELQSGRLEGTRADLKAHGLRIASVDASSRMHEKDAVVRQAQLDEGRRFIDLAHALGAPYVRVFGDHVPPDEERSRVLDRVTKGFQALAEHAKGAGVVVLMETHGDFTSSASIVHLMEAINRPEVRVLWDTHHTFATGREQPSETFGRIGQWVRHTHLKDSRPDGDGRRYVLAGQGDVPLRQIIDVLRTGGYDGYYSLEWEKAWHPGIDEPEVAFPQFADFMASIERRDAGAR
jgi:sugar phosphate isomerase/epimerase